MYEDLRAVVGGEGFSDEVEELEVYSRDSSYFREIPFCVVRPKTRDEVVGVLRVARENKTPVIPRGAGTNPCGEVVGRAIIIDLSRMDGIIEINQRDMYVVVEPGVVRDDLNNELKKHGLFFPPDPASSRVATIGGMVSNNSSGPHAVRYGTTKDYVLALEVVLSSGEVIELGTLALKSSSGYNLNHLFVGSEGTLGVFTKITLHLLPIPRHTATVTFTINGPEELRSIQKEILPLSPSAFEFMDEICLKVISKRQGSDFRESWALIAVEFTGSEKEVSRQVSELKKIVNTEHNIPNIWEIRKGMVPLLATYSEKRPIAITEDIGVPVSKIIDAVGMVKEIYGSAGFEVAVYGHLGDGNLHMRVFGDRTQELIQAADRIYAYVLSVGGTISSEHGIGRLRTRYMEMAHGNALKLMKKIKATIDEEGILNPGCLFD